MDSMQEIPVDPHDPLYGLGSLPDTPWDGIDDADDTDRVPGLVDLEDDSFISDSSDDCDPRGISRPNYQVREQVIRIGNFEYTKRITVIVSSNTLRRGK